MAELVGWFGNSSPFINENLRFLLPNVTSSRTPGSTCWRIQYRFLIIYFLSNSDWVGICSAKISELQKQFLTPGRNLRLGSIEKGLLEQCQHYKTIHQLCFWAEPWSLGTFQRWMIGRHCQLKIRPFHQHGAIKWDGHLALYAKASLPATSPTQLWGWIKTRPMAASCHRLPFRRSSCPHRILR